MSQGPALKVASHGVSGMQQTLTTRAMQAQASQEPFLETFAALLQDELERRSSTLMDRRYKRSGLDEKASLADLDWRCLGEFGVATGGGICTGHRGATLAALIEKLGNRPYGKLEVKWTPKSGQT